MITTRLCRMAVLMVTLDAFPMVSRPMVKVVIRLHRLFTAGLDHQAALGLMGDHRASGKVRHAVDGLDQDIRDTIFDHLAGERRPQ